MDYSFLNLMNTVGNISNTVGNVSSIGRYGSIKNVYRNNNSFDSTLRNIQAAGMKKEIYNRFNIEVGKENSTFECRIPEGVLSRMQTDTGLKEKVFRVLDKYCGDEFQDSIMGNGLPVKKCSLVFDENGEMTATLKTNLDSKDEESKVLLYQQLLMQQIALMSYGTNMYSGYNSLFGLDGIL